MARNSYDYQDQRLRPIDSVANQLHRGRQSVYIRRMLCRFILGAILIALGLMKMGILFW